MTASGARAVLLCDQYSIVQFVDSAIALSFGVFLWVRASRPAARACQFAPTLALHQIVHVQVAVSHSRSSIGISSSIS